MEVVEEEMELLDNGGSGNAAQMHEEGMVPGKDPEYEIVVPALRIPLVTKLFWLYPVPILKRTRSVTIPRLMVRVKTLPL